MARKRKKKILVGDFETTVYKGQKDTQVWASAVVELYTEDAKVFGSIEATWEYLLSLKSDILIYYHNLGFDGTFWLCYLLGKLKLKQAYEDLSTMDEFKVKWILPNQVIFYRHCKSRSYYSTNAMYG